MAKPELKDRIRAYWDAEACGEVYARGADAATRLAALRRARYGLEPYIQEFADFPRATGRDILEVGVGMGCDHLCWALAGPRRLAGIDRLQAAGMCRAIQATARSKISSRSASR